MKHSYYLIINQGKKAERPFEYSFARTQGIQIHLHSGSALIAFVQGAVHTLESARKYEDYLCSDAIKKAMLVHLILYSKPLAIRSLQLSIDGQVSETAIDKGDPVVYSMINHPLDAPLPATFRTEKVISTLLHTAKSSYDGRNNALIALLLAKASAYRSEKSMYLWMAMNGLYGYLSQEANKNASNRKKRITEEWQEHDLMCSLFGLGKASFGNIPNEEKTKIMQEAMSLLRKNDTSPEALYFCLREAGKNQLTDDLQGRLAEHGAAMEPCPFFCVWLPYQIRCKYFHSNSAIPLFSYADEPMMTVLQYTNCFVESFLEENLPYWLSAKNLTEEQSRRIEEAYRKVKGVS